MDFKQFLIEAGPSRTHYHYLGWVHPDATEEDIQHSTFISDPYDEGYKHTHVIGNADETSHDELAQSIGHGSEKRALLARYRFHPNDLMVQFHGKNPKTIEAAHHLIDKHGKNKHIYIDYYNAEAKLHNWRTFAPSSDPAEALGALWELTEAFDPLNDYGKNSFIGWITKTRTENAISHWIDPTGKEHTIDMEHAHWMQRHKDSHNSPKRAVRDAFRQGWVRAHHSNKSLSVHFLAGHDKASINASNYVAKYGKGKSLFIDKIDSNDYDTTHSGHFLPHEHDEAHNYLLESTLNEARHKKFERPYKILGKFYPSKYDAETIKNEISDFIRSKIDTDKWKYKHAITKKSENAAYNSSIEGGRYHIDSEQPTERITLWATSKPTWIRKQTKKENNRNIITDERLRRKDDVYPGKRIGGEIEPHDVVVLADRGVYHAVPRGITHKDERWFHSGDLIRKERKKQLKEEFKPARRQYERIGWIRPDATEHDIKHPVNTYDIAHVTVPHVYSDMEDDHDTLASDLGYDDEPHALSKGSVRYRMAPNHLELQYDANHDSAIMNAAHLINHWGSGKNIYIDKNFHGKRMGSVKFTDHKKAMNYVYGLHESFSKFLTEAAALHPGFDAWIHPDGQLHFIDDDELHSHYLTKFGIYTYGDAFKQGWVRISHDPRRKSLAYEFDKNVDSAAMNAANHMEKFPGHHIHIDRAPMLASRTGDFAGFPPHEHQEAIKFALSK